MARAVEEAALALGIAHLLDRPTAELSGGELQRVALGAALAGRPQLILLDEPTSQLDPVAGDELIALLRRLNEDFDAAIVIAEHRLERCLGFADRAIAMRGGRVVCDATPAEFLAWACDGRAGAGDPGRAAAVRPRAGAGGGREGGRVGAAGARAAPGRRSDRGRRPDRRDRKPRRRAEDPRSRSTGSGTRSIAGRPSSAASRCRSRPGERVALMGRNGAGKSTLLRHAAGLMRPTRGKVRSAGRVALLLQNPTDYLVHERVDAGGLAGARSRPSGSATPRSPTAIPRDLSGGEKQRLALAIVLDGDGWRMPGYQTARRVPRRADPRDGPPPQGRARGAAARARRRRARRHPRPRVRGRVRASGWCCWGRAR